MGLRLVGSSLFPRGLAAYIRVDRVARDSNETQSFFDMDRAHNRWDLRDVIKVSCARLNS